MIIMKWIHLNHCIAYVQTPPHYPSFFMIQEEKNMSEILGEEMFISPLKMW